MANEAYIDGGTSLRIDGASGADYAFSVEGLGDGAGRTRPGGGGSGSRSAPQPASGHATYGHGGQGHGGHHGGYYRGYYGGYHGYRGRYYVGWGYPYAFPYYAYAAWPWGWGYIKMLLRPLKKWCVFQTALYPNQRRRSIMSVYINRFTPRFIQNYCRFMRLCKKYGAKTVLE